jgi:hypothetical protein
MNEYTNMSASFNADDMNLNTQASNHMLNDGSDLFPTTTFEKLYEFTNVPRPADPVIPFSNEPSQELPSSPSSNDISYNYSYDSSSVIDFGDKQSDSAPLPTESAPQPIAQQSGDIGLGLTFNSDLPYFPSSSAPTISPAVHFSDIMQQSQISAAPTAVPDALFLWPPRDMNNTPQIQMAGSNQHQQQQWPVFANQNAQNFRPQPNLAQLQYMQAVHNLQFAQNQLAQNLQSPLDLQSPLNQQQLLNLQPPLNYHQSQKIQQTQSLQQQAQYYQQPQNLLPTYGFQQQAQNYQQTQNLPPARVFPLGQRVPLFLHAQSTPPEPLQTNATTQQHNSALSLAIAPLPVLRPAERMAESEDFQRPSKVRTAHTVEHVENAPLDPVLGQHQVPLTPTDGLTFTTLEEAEKAMTARNIPHEWRAPTPDGSIPQTHEDRSYWVLQMLEAMEDVEACKDHKNGFSFQKRWATLGYYKKVEMEKVCWLMLHIAERLHTVGPATTNIYDRDALKKLKAARNLTFEQRLTYVCEMLRLSKHLCDNLMKGEGIEALIGAPKQKLSGARTMQVQNVKRQDWLEKGRAKDAGEVYENTVTAQIDEEAIVVTKRTPKPTHKSRTARAKSRSRAFAPEATSQTSDDETDGSEFSHEEASDDEFEDDVDPIASPIPSVCYSEYGSPSPSHKPPRTLMSRGHKLTVDSVESDLENEEPAPAAKRPRKAVGGSARKPSPPYSDDELSDHNELEGDLENDKSDADGSSAEESEVEAPAPSLKRKRPTVPNRGHIIRRYPEVVLIESSDEPEDANLEDGPALPSKRTQKADTEPTRKSARPAPVTKNTPIPSGNSQRDARGRFIPRPTATSARATRIRVALKNRR